MFNHASELFDGVPPSTATLSSSLPKMEQLTNQVWQTIFPRMKGAD